MTRLTRIITKHNAIVIGTAIVISVLIFIFGRGEKKPSPKPNQFTYKIFFIQSGWGYDVLVDNKVYIHQEIVPTLQVQKGFNKKEYAEKAAQLVVQKLQHSQFPALLKSDLSKICAFDSLVYEQPAAR